MSITRLAVSLDSFHVGLSGAIPNREDWSEPAMDRGILEFVALLSGIVIKYGGRIVHGCHPTFTPVILRQARLQGSSRKRRPVTLVMSELWAQDLRDDEIKSMTDIAELIVTKKVGEGSAEVADTRNRSLTAMREVLMDVQNITVALGGMMHNGDGIIPGVREELELSESRGLPRFLVGGLGGMSKTLAESLAPARLRNFLSDDDNMTLYRTDNVAACVNVLFEHFAGSQELTRFTGNGVMWDPTRGEIFDIQTGAVASSTRHIQRTY